MLHVHRSHDVPALAGRLAALLADPLTDPFQAEHVMVASSGIARWLETYMATHTPGRVWANVKMPYPAAFVRFVVDDVLGPVDVMADPWDPTRLGWIIAEHLPDLVAADPALATLATYLAAGSSDASVPEVVDRRMLGLSQQLAGLLDRYALFRPAMLAAWRDGQDVLADGVTGLGEHAWQAALYRGLLSQQDVPSPAQRVADAIDQLMTTPPSDAVPVRLAVFGLSTLPPLQLSLLAAVARHREVHLFVPSPSPTLWALGLAGDRAARPKDALLRAAGPVGRDTPVLLRDAAAGVVELRDTLLPALRQRDPSTVLGALQSAMLTDLPPHAAALAADDRSIVFHDCHGPLRQVEALRDELLRRLCDDPTLQPRDIAVLTPDVATYGPLVAAVFGSAAHARALGGRSRDGAPPLVPVAVADRSAGTGNPLASVLRRAIALVTSRASAAEVMDLLATEPVRTHLRITPSELETIDRWVSDTGVRWARDAVDREAAGQPARDAHTWAAAIDRLVTGVALADEEARTIGGVVPYDHVEDAGDLDLLERLLAFLDVVDGLRTLQAPLPVGGWIDACGTVLDALTGPADGYWWLENAERSAHRRNRERVDGVLAELGPVRDVLGRDLDVRAFARWLDGALDERGGSGGHGTGAVTVAELVPLRAVPYRVICLLGLDTGSFPRSSSHPGHDLVAAQPQPGDRDRRDEDRHLFVEAVQSASDGLVVLFSGRDQRTGRSMPPAVPVSELRDAVEAVVSKDGLAALTTIHAVLPISPKAFDPDSPVSFDADRLHAAARMQREPEDVADFVPGAVADGRGDEQLDAAGIISLDELARGVRDPGRALAATLRLSRAEEASVHDDVEPLELDALGRSGVGRVLLAAARTGTPIDRELAAIVRRGGTPAGPLGARAVAPIRGAVEQMLGIAERFKPDSSHAVDVAVGQLRLVGSVATGDDGGVRTICELAYRRPGPTLYLPARMAQLALAVQLPDVGVQVVLVHRAATGNGTGVTVLPSLPPELARAELAAWIELHRRSRTQRVDLIPNVSWAYQSTRRGAELAAVDAGHEAVDVEGATDDELTQLAGDVAYIAGVRTKMTVSLGLDKARSAARRVWEGDQWSKVPPARDDDTNRLLYRHAPLFEELAARTTLLATAGILRPLVDAVEDGADAATSIIEEVV
ncbi:MAG: exodeoxyribonuclease V gamma subunit [Nonlabens sp.]